MHRFGPYEDRLASAEIVDFDEVLLEACSPDERAELLAEAEIVARAFAPGGNTERLEALCCALSLGVKDDELSRAHARKLAAALHRLSRRPRRRRRRRSASRAKSTAAP